jgi:PHP family Zn ribbon phosphoesterase
MTNVKKRLLASIRKMMLNCEKASLISTQEMVENVGLKSRMGLRLHLAACKHCRKYYQQTKLLSRIIHHQNKTIVRGTTLPHRLSVIEKSNLQRLITNRIQS